METYREIEKNTVDGTLWPCGVAPSMALVKSAYFTYPVDGASPVFNAMNFDPGVCLFKQRKHPENPKNAQPVSMPRVAMAAAQLSRTCAVRDVFRWEATPDKVSIRNTSLV